MSKRPFYRRQFSRIARLQSELEDAVLKLEKFIPETPEGVINMRDLAEIAYSIDDVAFQVRYLVKAIRSKIKEREDEQSIDLMTKLKKELNLR